jgi:Flp pilus assembly protein TadG
MKPMHAAMRGVAAVEFAIAAPLLLILLAGLIEVGYRVFESMQVQNAAEAGALYVAIHGWDSAGISAAVVNATGISGVTATPAPTQFCGCPAAGAIAATNCASTCSGGAAAGGYVQVNASLAHQTIMPFPGLTLPATLTGYAIVRVN